MAEYETCGEAQQGAYGNLPDKEVMDKQWEWLSKQVGGEQNLR